MTERLHRICHNKIHSLFDNKLLAAQYASAEALLEHPEIRKFVAWVRNKDPEFYDRNERHRDKR